MAEVLIRGDEHLEVGCLGDVEQLAVAKHVPALVSCFCNGVSEQNGNASRDAVVEENEHLV